MSFDWDSIEETLHSLDAFRANLPDKPYLSQKYVARYHEFLDQFKTADSALDEHRIPDDEVRRRRRSISTMGGAPTLRKDPDVERSVLMARLDAVVKIQKKRLDFARTNLADVGDAKVALNGAMPTSKKIFVVHGHDEALREAIARELDLEPIILPRARRRTYAGLYLASVGSNWADVFCHEILAIERVLGLAL